MHALTRRVACISPDSIVWGGCQRLGDFSGVGAVPEARWSA